LPDGSILRRKSRSTNAKCPHQKSVRANRHIAQIYGVNNRANENALVLLETKNADFLVHSS